MKFLLINTNQVVQKLVEVTAKKANSRLDLLKSFESFKKIGDFSRYSLVIIDDEVLQDNAEEFFSLINGVDACFIHSKDTPKIDGFKYYIKKPFLPNELLGIINTLSSGSSVSDDDIFGDENNEYDSLSLDDIDFSGDKLFDNADEKVADEAEKKDDLDGLGDIEKLGLDGEFKDDGSDEFDIESLDEFLGGDDIESIKEDLQDIKKIEDDEIEDTQEEEAELEDDDVVDDEHSMVLNPKEIDNIKTLLEEGFPKDSRSENNHNSSSSKIESGKIDGKDFIKDLSKMPISYLKELLDGMQITINISFPKK